MNATTRTTSFGALKQQATTFWEERNQRERTMLLVAAVAILVALIYLLLIDPALSGRVDLKKRLPALRQQSAELQALSKDAAALTATASAPVAKMTRESLDAALARKGLKAQSVNFSGDLAQVQLTGASFAGIVEWLDELQRTARVSVVDATVDAQAQPDTVNAKFALRQQSGQGQ